MTSQQILQSDFLDILFEKRNKLYGAYLLRRNYPIELMKAISITILLVALLMFFGSSSKRQANASLLRPDIEITSVVIEPPKKPDLPKVQQPKQSASPVKQVKLNDNLVIVEKTPDPIATQTDLKDALPGNEIVAGPAFTGVAPQPPTVSNGTGSGDAEPEKVDPPLPSRSPQFPGGTQAWLNFLSRHLRPPQDLEPGEKRSCLIRFSVDEEGMITNFQVAQSGGAEFDNEVIRVLKKMPKWLPAIQNGKPAAVSFTQPVTFVAQED